MVSVPNVLLVLMPLLTPRTNAQPVLLVQLPLLVLLRVLTVTKSPDVSPALPPLKVNAQSVMPDTT